VRTSAGCGARCRPRAYEGCSILCKGVCRVSLGPWPFPYSPNVIVQRLQFVCLEPCEQWPIPDKEISTGINSFMQSVPGNTILHLPCVPADPCSDQRSPCNPMEFETHALLVPACQSAPLQGSLVHHKYSSCNFGILHYPLYADTELYYPWRPPDGAQSCRLILFFQFVACTVVPLHILPGVLHKCPLRNFVGIFRFCSKELSTTLF
jgi:hypothetical protein